MALVSFVLLTPDCKSFPASARRDALVASDLSGRNCAEEYMTRIQRAQCQGLSHRQALCQADADTESTHRFKAENSPPAAESPAGPTSRSRASSHGPHGVSILASVSPERRYK